jgi:cystathionine beta-lyase/cystathionine gamma-synthase
MDKLNFLTRLVHEGLEGCEQTGSVIPPIYQTSTFRQSSPGQTRGYDYSRADNPTRAVLEKAFASLEGAKYGLAFSSGLAAIQAIVHSLPEAGRVLVCDDVYGGTGRLFSKIFTKSGFEFKFIDTSNIDTVKDHIDSTIKMVWLESPSNPTLKLADIKKISNLTKESGALLVVDNTFATPVFQLPLELGADIVVHSTTKYIGGHSDLIGGAVMLSQESLYEELKFLQMSIGSVPGPMDCFLLLRSLKTLGLRMKQHEKNALEVARFLQSNSKVEKVYYPGINIHPQYELACRQMCGFSGMLSFSWRGEVEKMFSMIKKLKLFILAESLGGVESLINHPEKMTHASVPKDLRKKLGINANLLRLSVGIESAADLIADLDQAFSSV